MRRNSNEVFTFIGEQPVSDRSEFSVRPGELVINDEARAPVADDRPSPADAESTVGPPAPPDDIGLDLSYLD